MDETDDIAYRSRILSDLRFCGKPVDVDMPASGWQQREARAAAPDVATVAESGAPGFEVTVSYGP